ncbi:MAG: hypothetical protein OET90_04840, partial [Desulfuromonadales bacterium]|nr:hypothetical protein [Desulfuromonadales bacterium]
PLDMDVDLLGRVLRAQDNASTATALNKVGWLNRYSDKPLAITDLEHIISEEFSSRLQVEWLPSEPTSVEWSEAETLLTDKFANANWTMRF